MSTKGKPTKSKQGQPPPIDKLIKPAIAVGLALLAYQFFKGLNTEVSCLGHLDVTLRRPSNVFSKMI